MSVHRTANLDTPQCIDFIKVAIGRWGESVWQFTRPLQWDKHSLIQNFYLSVLI